MRVIVLVDGEHYPPVTRWGIDVARERGYDVLGALLVGGIEKIDPGHVPDLGVPTRVAGADRMASLGEAIDVFAPEAVLDLSDEPVLGYRERMELVAVALSRGVPYLGSDFRLDPSIARPAAFRADARRDRDGETNGQDRDRGGGGEDGCPAGSRADRRGDGARRAARAAGRRGRLGRRPAPAPPGP